MKSKETQDRLSAAYSHAYNDLMESARSLARVYKAKRPPGGCRAHDPAPGAVLRAVAYALLDPPPFNLSAASDELFVQELLADAIAVSQKTFSISDSLAAEVVTLREKVDRYDRRHGFLRDMIEGALQHDSDNCASDH